MTGIIRFPRGRPNKVTKPASAPASRRTTSASGSSNSSAMSGTAGPASAASAAAAAPPAASTLPLAVASPQNQQLSSGGMSLEQTLNGQQQPQRQLKFDGNLGVDGVLPEAGSADEFDGAFVGGSQFGGHTGSSGGGSGDNDGQDSMMVDGDILELHDDAAAAAAAGNARAGGGAAPLEGGDGRGLDGAADMPLAAPAETMEEDREAGETTGEPTDEQTEAEVETEAAAASTAAPTATIVPAPQAVMDHLATVFPSSPLSSSVGRRTIQELSSAAAPGRAPEPAPLAAAAPATADSASSASSSSLPGRRSPTAPGAEPSLTGTSSSATPATTSTVITTAQMARDSGYSRLVVESALAKRLAWEPGLRPAQQRRPEQQLNLSRRSNVEALFAHIAGAEAPMPCKNCHKGHGPWTACVVVDGQMCGSCANCWFNASGARCSFHETKTPIQQHHAAMKHAQPTSSFGGSGALSPSSPSVVIDPQLANLQQRQQQLPASFNTASHMSSGTPAAPRHGLLPSTPSSPSTIAAAVAVAAAAMQQQQELRRSGSSGSHSNGAGNATAAGQHSLPSATSFADLCVHLTSAIMGSSVGRDSSSAGSSHRRARKTAARRRAAATTASDQASSHTGAPAAGTPANSSLLVNDIAAVGLVLDGALAQVRRADRRARNLMMVDIAAKQLALAIARVAEHDSEDSSDDGDTNDHSNDNGAQGAEATEGDLGELDAELGDTGNDLAGRPRQGAGGKTDKNGMIPGGRATIAR